MSERGHFFIAHTKNYRHKEDGFILHVADDRGGGPTLCGVKQWTGTFATLDDVCFPGCIRCRRKLKNLGIEEKQ